MPVTTIHNHERNCSLNSNAALTYTSMQNSACFGEPNMNSPNNNGNYHFNGNTQRVRERIPEQSISEIMKMLPEFPINGNEQ